MLSIVITVTICNMFCVLIGHAIHSMARTDKPVKLHDLSSKQKKRMLEGKSAIEYYEDEEAIVPEDGGDTYGTKQRS